MCLSKTLSVSMDYLLLGEISNTLKNPIVDFFNKLSQRRREDALKFLQIYANACNV